MEVDFVKLRDDGTVDARLGPAWPLFNEALADAISSLPPRGSLERHLSTYWIDTTLARMEALTAEGQTGVIAAGNAYSILLEPDGVRAVFDYAESGDDGEQMATEDFTDLLHRWRTAVVEIQHHHPPEVPDTYRRNPAAW